MKIFIIISLIFGLVSCSSKDLEIVQEELRKKESLIQELREKEENLKLEKEILEEKYSGLEKYLGESTFDLSYEQYNFQKKLPILLFHYIRDIDKNSPDQLGYRLSNSIERFEEILIYLQEQGIETITFKDVKRLIETNGEFPQKSIILSFDDGHLDHYTQAHRLLKEYNMKGVFYIVSDFASNDPIYANWDQLREMSDYGHEIGSHTLNHPDLTRLKTESLYNQLVESKNKIEQELDTAVISLAYPLGKYDSRVLNIASENYLFSRTTRGGTNFSLQKRHTLPGINMLPTFRIETIGSYYR